ncbi:MAG: glycosyltransferase family 2 protein, partial [Chloroflexi bacterium]|nr:glycosyltransferase family 2 protein [Chloroflexota bacterium]
MTEKSGNEKGKYPFVSVLVLNWNGRSLLANTLPPLLVQDYPNYEVVLVDNASTDDSVAFVQQQFPQVRVVQHAENLGFSRGYNVVLANQQADIVLLMNNDVVATPECITAVTRPLITDNNIGIVGGKLLFPNNSIQHAGATLTYPLATSNHFHYKEDDTGQVPPQKDVNYVTGAVMAISQQVLTNVGLLDSGFYPFYYEEVDYCYRVRAAGYRVVAVSDNLGIHDESTSMKRVKGKKAHAYQKNRLRFVLKHYTPTQFLHDFVPAEQASLEQVTQSDVLQLLRLVYLETAVSLPTLFQTLDYEGEIMAVQTALITLRQAAETQTLAVHRHQPHNGSHTQLIRSQILTEPTFQSDIPILGTLIVGF